MVWHAGRQALVQHAYQALVCCWGVATSVMEIHISFCKGHDHVWSTPPQTETTFIREKRNLGQYTLQRTSTQYLYNKAKLDSYIGLKQQQKKTFQSFKSETTYTTNYTNYIAGKHYLFMFLGYEHISYACWWSLRYFPWLDKCSPKCEPMLLNNLLRENKRICVKEMG